MANPNPSFQSKRVKRRNQLGITSDRYEFLGLDQAEPDLGDPLIGVSSVGANPFPVEAGDPYVLVSDGSKSGKRYWTQRANIIAGGVVQPGAISIYQNGILAPGTNELSVFKVNFTGAGVTVIGVGSDRADVDITVTDVSIFSGQTGSIGYKDNNNLLQGSNSFIFNPSNNNVGIGSTQPKERLDILGNSSISNNLSVGSTLTAKKIIANSFNVDKFIITDNTIIFQVAESGIGIGTTRPISTLDVRGDVNISGYTTVGNLRSNDSIISNTLGITSNASIGSLSIGNTQIISSTRQLQNILSLDSVTTATIEDAIRNAPNTFNDLNVTGITTIGTLNVTGLTTTKDFNATGISTIVNLRVNNSLNSTGISTITNLHTVNLRTTGISTFNILNVSGLTTTKDLLVTGITTVNDFYINQNRKVSVASSVGIGTDNPRYDLDVNGSIRFTGALYTKNGSGTQGQVLISDGLNSPTWGSPSEVTAGSATSVTTIDKAGINTSYHISFVEKTIGSLNQSIYLDSDNLTYNPSTNTLSVDTVTTKTIQVDGLSRVTVGIVTTSSKNEVVIDNLDTTLFRSARYNIQVNTTGQLILNNSISISGLSSGRNYYPGTYNNIPLNNVTGVGTDARANITVIPEATLPIVGSLNGLFTTSGSLVGIGTSQSVVFTQEIPPSNYENSRVTNIILTNSGSGYTSIPTLIFSSPIISGNPVESVGVGSTAIGIVNSMKVTDFIFRNSGFLTSIVPSVTISSPTSGTTATANVGYAVSTISVTNSGIGYLSIPTVQFGSGSASAGVSSIFVNRVIVTNPGFGYTTGDLNTLFVFSSGSASATNNSFSLPNSHLGFTITRPGVGYTEPPRLTVANPQIGINTGIVTCTLGISTAIITQVGSGYTRSPSFTLSPEVSNFDGYVGMGVSSLGLQLYGGGGYDSNPSVSFTPVGGIGTGAQAIAQINISGQVESITITNPGFGYTVPPLVVFTGGTPEVSAAATIRTLTAQNFVINNTGFGVTGISNIFITPRTVEFLDNPFSITGVVGVATTSRVDNIIFSSQGTLSIASTTIISGISTFNTVIREKTGNLDTINDTSISGIDTSNVSVGFAVTGTFVQGGTTVASISSGTIGLSTNLTNPTVGFGLTFYISDTLSQRVIVGQGVSGPSINLTGNGTTVISIGNSSVTLSRETLNTGIQTSTFFFGTLTTIPGIFQTNIITGITTSGISTGQRVISTITPENTNVLSVGVGSITISNNTTNTSIATTTFTLFDVFTAIGTGAFVNSSMGIGRVTVGVDTTNPLNLGFGTGYTALPGIAVTAIDGITGGGGIVTTSSFGIDTNCINISNSGIYTSVPSVLINSPKNGSGSATIANVGIGVSTVRVTSSGFYTNDKPTVSFSGGSPLVSAAATVNNIVLNNLNLVNSGSGYTAGNLPVTATFSNVSLGATVGLGVDSIILTSTGLGYTVTPTITFTNSILPGGIVASANATLSNFGSSFNLLSGPGYGNTFVYYIEPVSSNTFRLFRDINRVNQVTLGFSTVGNPSALVGGRVSNVTITNGGSGYQNGNILNTSAISLGNTFSSNVGTGFSFTTTNIIQNYQISDIMLLQSVGSARTTVDIIEYGGISNLEDLISFSADINGPNARLKVTPKYRDNTVKFTRTSITI